MFKVWRMLSIAVLALSSISLGIPFWGKQVGKAAPPDFSNPVICNNDLTDFGILNQRQMQVIPDESFNGCLHPPKDKAEDFVIRLPWSSSTDGYTITKGYATSPLHTNDCNGDLAKDYYALDFNMPDGTEIYPIAPGTVIFAGDSQQGYGNIVYIDHEGYESLYAHLSSVKVEQGQQVNLRTILGLSGHTGDKWEPHLHFALYSGSKLGSKVGHAPYGGHAVKPEPFIGREPYRNLQADEHKRYYASPPMPDLAGEAIKQSPFPLLFPGDTTTLEFEVQNTGARSWMPDGTYRLMNVNSLPLDAPPQNLVNMVSYGKRTLWAVNIRAPMQPGIYTTEWQMVHNKELFGPKASWNVIVVPKVEGEITPVAILKQWWEQQKQRIAEEFYELVEKLKRAGEEWLQRELERLWREFWESLFRQCCGANAIAPAVLLLGAWGINHKWRRRTKDGDRG